MSSGYEVVDEVRLGDQEVSREGILSEWKTIRAVFTNFAGLSSEPGVRTLSPVLRCHGLEWVIELCPGGRQSVSSEEDVPVSLRLGSMSCTKTNKIRAKKRIRIPSAGVAKGGERLDIFSLKNAAGEFQFRGLSDFVKRKDVLKTSKNYLVGGNLTVEVDIQVLDKPPVWTPTNTVCSDMLKILDTADAETADV